MDNVFSSIDMLGVSTISARGVLSLSWSVLDKFGNGNDWSENRNESILEDESESEIVFMGTSDSNDELPEYNPLSSLNPSGELKFDVKVFLGKKLSAAKSNVGVG